MPSTGDNKKSSGAKGLTKSEDARGLPAGKQACWIQTAHSSTMVFYSFSIRLTSFNCESSAISATSALLPGNCCQCQPSDPARHILELESRWELCAKVEAIALRWKARPSRTEVNQWMQSECRKYIYIYTYSCVCVCLCVHIVNFTYSTCITRIQKMWLKHWNLETYQNCLPIY